MAQCPFAVRKIDVSRRIWVGPGQPLKVSFIIVVATRSIEMVQHIAEKIERTRVGNGSTPGRGIC